MGHYSTGYVVVRVYLDYMEVEDKFDKFDMVEEEVVEEVGLVKKVHNSEHCLNEGEPWIGEALVDYDDMLDK